MFQRVGELGKKIRGYHLQPITVPHVVHALVLCAILYCMVSSTLHRPIITIVGAGIGLLLMGFIQSMRFWNRSGKDLDKNHTIIAQDQIVHKTRWTKRFRVGVRALWNASRTYSPMAQRLLIVAFVLIAVAVI